MKRLRLWSLMSGIALCANQSLGAQANASELYSTAQEAVLKSDFSCKATVEQYIDGLKYVYAFEMVALFNGMFTDNKSLKDEVVNTRSRVESNAKRCLQIQRGSSGQNRSDGTEPAFTPPPPPRLPNIPLPLTIRTATGSNADVAQWRERAAQAEARASLADRRVSTVSGQLATLRARAMTLVGMWEMAFGTQKALISFTSTGPAWACADVDATTAKVTDLPCAVHLDPGVTRITLPAPDRTATLTVKFDGPERLTGDMTITTPGAATSDLTPVTLTRKP